MSKLSVTTKLVDPQMLALMICSMGDTEFFGIRVGRAVHLDGLAQWAADNTVGLMCLLVDADKPEEIQEAEERGFRFMDVRVTLDMPATSRASWARLAKAEDTMKLIAISREAFHLTRFYADPTLDNSRCDDLYAEWTRSSCAGAADIVLVVEQDNVPVGYVTVDVDEDHAEIGLIAVAADYRGQHLGTVLVNGAIDWAHTQNAKTIRVVTQGRNTGALRTFEGCGFRVTNTSLWFHRRYQP